MTMARWQATIADARGRAMPGASITVRREISGLPLEVLYSDREGTTPLGNPFTADSEGFAAFHCAGGAFQITATSGAFSRTWRYVGIGLGGEFDGPVNIEPQAAYDGGTAYAKNDVVADQGGSWLAKQATTGNAPPTLPTTSNDYWLLLAGPGAAGTGITGNVIELAEVSTPSAPSSGSHKAYFKADGKFYTLANAGAEQAFAMQDIPPITLTGSTETAALAHAGQIVEMNNGSPNDYVIPPNSSVSFPIGAIITIEQIGAGVTTIVADTGVTLNGVSAGEAEISERWQGVSIRQRATDEWVMVGAHEDVA